MKLTVAVFALILMFPGLILASSTVRTGDTVSIALDQTVAGDFYGFGSTVAISGDVAEDLILGGGDITLNGNFGADILAIGGIIDIYGNVADDVRLVAGSVTIAGEIKGNLVVVAGELNILSTARIEGDVIFFGEQAEISGFVGKDVYGTSGKMRIDGVVNGGVDVRTKSLVLGDRAEIANNVSYTSLTDLVRAQDAKVNGKILRNDVTVVDTNNLQAFLIPLLLTLFGALVWYLIFKRFIGQVIEGVYSRPLLKSSLGFGVFFLLPISASILFVSTLGALLGLTLIFFYILLILVTITITGIVTGSLLSKVITKNTAATPPFIILGVLVVHLLLYIPIVGPVLLVLLMAVTMGSLADRLYKMLKAS